MKSALDLQFYRGRFPWARLCMTDVAPEWFEQVVVNQGLTIQYQPASISLRALGGTSVQAPPSMSLKAPSGTSPPG